MDDEQEFKPEDDDEEADDVEYSKEDSDYEN